MNRFRNFPASENMSEFEIVELQNEMLRQRRIQNESKEESKEEKSESDDDSSTEDSTTMIDISEDDIASDLNEDEFDTEALDSRLSDDNLYESLESSENSHNDSNDSNQSYITPLNSFSQHQEIIPVDLSPENISALLKYTQVAQHQNIIPIQFNNIKFLEDLNKANDEFGTIGSTVRMGFQSKQLNEFFICHICCIKQFPKIGQIPIIGAYNIGITKGNGYQSSGRLSISPPGFPRNIAAFIQHLANNHSNRDQITIKANKILNKLKLEMDGKSSPLFRYPTCIRKSASSSCLTAQWKSNQTDLTFKMAHNYVFSGNECKGHTQCLFTEGKPYVNDWSHSVYCSCDAKTIKAQWNHSNPLCIEEIPPPSPPAQVYENIVQGLPNSFFAENKTSISYMHKTIRCPYKIRFDYINPIPPLTSGVTTRAMSNKDNLDQNKHTEMKKQKASSSDKPPTTPIKSSLKTPHSTAERTRTGGNNSPLKKAAASAVDLLKPTGPKKKVTWLSKI